MSLLYSMHHLIQYYIIYQQLMDTINLIIWCYCILCQCLILTTHNSIGLMMCSLLWVVARYWKMSSAIQSIQICKIVLTFTIPWDRSRIGYFLNSKCFMMSWLVLSYQCLGDLHRRCLETRLTNFVKHWTSGTSTHNSCNHFLLIPFISQTWRCQMKSNRAMV